VETGILAGEIKQLKQAHLFLIPASTETRGHGTMMLAKFYSAKLKTFLASIPGHDK
jgi:homoserine O-acetyltransferase